MSFPEDYPFNPPTFRFNREFYHPNGKWHHPSCTRSFIDRKAIVYPDGRLCISILHPPGDDPVSGEKAEVTNQ